MARRLLSGRPAIRATDDDVAEPEILALEEAGRRLLTSTRDALPTDVPEGILDQPACEWMLTNTLPPRIAWG